MTTHTYRKRNHFPDWLFYGLTVVLLTTGSLSVIFYSKTEQAVEHLTQIADSLAVVRINMHTIDSVFGNQGRFEIKNMGTQDFTIRDFFVCYFDSTRKTFQTLRGTMDKTLRTNESCRPVYHRGMNALWDGRTLCYFLTIQPGGLMKGMGDLYYAGQLQEGKAVEISVDNRDDNSDFFVTTCN